MRNALTVLLVSAGLILLVGGVNHSLLLDIDVVVWSWTAVSVFWVSVVIAAVVFAVGLAAALFARSRAAADQRRLEIELENVYERLRAAEARAPEAAPEGGETEAVGVTPEAGGAASSAGETMEPAAETPAADAGAD